MSDFLFDRVHAHRAPNFAQFDATLLIPSAEEGLRRARARLDEIINNPEMPTFENTIEALLHHSREFDYIYRLYAHATNSLTSDSLEKAGEMLEPLQAAYKSDLLANAPLFERIKFMRGNMIFLKLDNQQKAVLEQKYREFSNNGALLSDADKLSLKDINSKLLSKTSHYRKNMMGATKAFGFPVENEAMMDGIPEDTKARAAEHAKKLNLDVPYALGADNATMLHVLGKCANRELRTRYFHEITTLCQSEPYDNTPVVMDILRLRHERARLLGAENFAIDTLKNRMLDSTEKVHSFLDKLTASSHIAEQNEMKELAAYALEHDGINDIGPADMRYYMDKIITAKGYDTEAIKTYLEAEPTVNATLDHFSKLFGIHFSEPIGKYSTNDPHMRAFEIRLSLDQDEPTALIYMDLYQRDGKRPGAWLSPMIRSSNDENGNRQIPVSFVTMNLPLPAQNAPSLLLANDLQTLFHEMGHALHASLSTVRYADIAGINTKWDFVELPSMLLEKWAKHPDVLRGIARHHETGEPMPEDMIANIGKSMDCPGIFYKRQSFFSKMDMFYHSINPQEITSIEDAEKFISEAVGGTAFERATTRRFQHIFSGSYAAGYYSYMWSETLASDAFRVFQEKGIYDRTAANSLREEILSKGASKEPIDLFRAFTGRDPDANAMFEFIGLPVLDETQARPALSTPALAPQL